MKNKKRSKFGSNNKCEAINLAAITTQQKRTILFVVPQTE